MTMTILTKDDILTADDKKAKEVEVKEWGGAVRMIPMSGVERDEFEAMIQKRTVAGGKVDGRGIRVALIALSLVDENGVRIFQTKEDEALLNKKASPVLEELFKAAQKVNGLGDDDIKELEKN